MNSTQTIFKITELFEIDLPQICYDAAGQLALYQEKSTGSSIDTQSGAIAQKSATTIRTLNTFEQAHLDYAFYWLNHYEPEADCSDLERVEGYLEAFYHLCELSLWQQAYQVSCIPIDGKFLHEMLGDWGYYIQQIEIYQKLLNKINPLVDCVFLNGLGYAFHLLGQTNKSFQYYKAQLKLARKTQNHEYECRAWKGLGLNYYRIHDQNKTIRCYLNQLNCAELHQVLHQKFSAFLELGHAYSGWFDPKVAIKYFQNAVDIADNMGNSKNKALAIQGLLNTWCILCHARKIRGFLADHNPELTQDLNLHEKVLHYELMGRCFVILNNPRKSTYFYHQCLDTLRKIKEKFTQNNTLQQYDYPSEHYVLHNLGVVYCFKLKDPQSAIQYLEQAYEVAHKIPSTLRMSLTLSVLVHCYCRLGKTQLATEWGQRGLALAQTLEDSIPKGYAIAAWGSVVWHQGQYLRAVLTVARGLWIASSLGTVNTRLIAKAFWDLIIEKFSWKGEGASPPLISRQNV